MKAIKYLRRFRFFCRPRCSRPSERERGETETAEAAEFASVFPESVPAGWLPGQCER